MNEQESIERTKLARGNAPEWCKNCKHLSGAVEENQFTAPSEGGYKRYGSKDVYPYCLLLIDECPTNIKWCPLVQQEIHFLSLACRNCKDLIIKSYDDIYCNKKDCEHYKEA